MIADGKRGRLLNVTEQLAAYVTSSRLEAVPTDVRHEARRALLNFVGCAIGGTCEPAVEIALKVVEPFSGERTANILGRRDRLDPLHASLIHGVASHVHDYDDTTPGNYSHTTSPVASALFAYASAQHASGADLMHAFILGFEAASRIGNAVSPSHYDAGWHITSTIGVIGAAVAVGRLRGLCKQRMISAIGLAATQSAGFREMFGSMGKSFHPGRSAQNGYFAALLAEQGYTSAELPIEGARGFAAVFSREHDFSKIIDRLGGNFALRTNMYKPFPCGLVIHPTIDACMRIYAERKLSPDDILSVRLRVAPIVLDLCNKKSIATGLEGKFSVYHAAAVGLVRGRAGLAEFSDAAVNDAAIRSVRDRVSADRDASITDRAVTVEVTLRNGERLSKMVENAIGTVERPLSDRDLEEKFRDQTQQRLSSRQIDELIDLCWRIDRLDRAGRIAEAAMPSTLRARVE